MRQWIAMFALFLVIPALAVAQQDSKKDDGMQGMPGMDDAQMQGMNMGGTDLMTMHFVDRRLLIGKALFIYWPHSFDYVNVLNHKIPFPFFPNFRSYSAAISMKKLCGCCPSAMGFPKAVSPS